MMGSLATVPGAVENEAYGVSCELFTGQRRSLRTVSSVAVELGRGMGTTIPTHALNADSANAAAINFKCFMSIPRNWLTPA